MLYRYLKVRNTIDSTSKILSGFQASLNQKEKNKLCSINKILFPFLNKILSYYFNEYQATYTVC